VKVATDCMSVGRGSRAMSAAAGPANHPEPTPGDPLRSPNTYMYEAPWPLHPLAWSSRPGHPFRLAAGSFLRDASNRIDILQVNQVSGRLEPRAAFPHAFPATKIMFLPDATATAGPDLLATTSGALRLWEISEDGTQMLPKACLTGGKRGAKAAPLASFDWNPDDLRIIGTASVDTTCSMWDIAAEKATMQLIAHDRAVFDLAFAPGPHVFGSVGADGSVRMFDLRGFDRSTIMYESPDGQPALRLSWNRQDPQYLATILADSSSVLILDPRVPSVPVLLLNGHTAAVNAVQWAPNDGRLLCSAGDDGRAAVWDLTGLPATPTPSLLEEPECAFQAPAGIHSLQWAPAAPGWLAAAFGTSLRLLRL